MAQQPNIELRAENLPRPTVHPAPARRWRPQRPGELGSPDQVPWGGMFGTPGPDTGFVLRLLASTDIPMGEGEEREGAVAALGAIAAARASRLGRAPTRGDVAAALLLLGYDADGIPGAVISALASDRAPWLAGITHRPGAVRRLVAAVAVDALTAPPATIRSRIASGERLIAL